MQELRLRVQRALPYAFGLALLQIALSLVGMVLLVRHLSPADYGVWTLLQGLIGPVELVASFGFLMVLVRSLPSLGDRDAIARLVWRVTLRRLMLTTALATVLVAAFPIYAERYELAAHRLEVRILPIFLVPAVGSAYLTASLNALFEQRAVLAAAFGCQLVMIGATVAGIVQDRTLLYFMVVLAAATSLQFAALSALFARKFGAPRPGDLLRPVLETDDQRRYRRVSWLDDFGVRVLSTDVDRYLIGFFSANTQVAVYAVASTIAARLEYFLPHRMLQSVIEPAVYRRYEEAGGVPGVAPIFGALFKVNYLLAFGFLSVFLALGGELLRSVFGEVYDASWAPTLIFLAFLAFNTNPLGMVIHAVRRPELLVFSKMVIPINLLLAWLLVPRFGALGMAVATGATMVLKNAALFAVAERRLGLSIPWAATLRCAAATALAAGAGRLIPDVVPLALRVGLVGLIYLPSALWLGAFERADARLAAGLLPEWVQRRLPAAWVAAG